VADSKPPPERDATLRERLREALLRHPSTALELSSAAGLREKDVADHLAHLARSLEHRGERLDVEPASCIACGYYFASRERLSRPGSCPRCGSTRIEPPVYRIARR
jgi:predicted Zn-ribbon and HTH transcriptional regulator